MQAQLAIQRHVDGPALSKVTRFGPMSKRRDMQEPQEIGLWKGTSLPYSFFQEARKRNTVSRLNAKAWARDGSNSHPAVQNPAQ